MSLVTSPLHSGSAYGSKTEECVQSSSSNSTSGPLPQYTGLWSFREKNVLEEARTWPEAVKKLTEKDPKRIKRKWRLVHKETEDSSSSSSSLISGRKRKVVKIINKSKQHLIDGERHPLTSTMHSWTPIQDVMLMIFRGPMDGRNSWETIARKMARNFPGVVLTPMAVKKRYEDLNFQKMKTS